MHLPQTFLSTPGPRTERIRITSTQISEPVVLSLALFASLLVATPVIAIVVLALQPAPDLWPHLLNYVLPFALRDTTLLLFGVGFMTLIIGAGTAWLISLHEFPGRSTLLWLMPLPLAILTYIAAYVYVDMFEPLGSVHRALTLWLPVQDAVAALPNLRSLPGAIFIIGLVLYPYVYLSARAMFQLQSAEFSEAAKTLGAGRWSTFWRVSLPMARPALAVGLALVALETLNDIGASEYLGVRTLDRVDLQHLAQPRQLGRRCAVVLFRAGHCVRIDRTRTLRTAPRQQRIFLRKPKADASDIPFGPERLAGLNCMLHSRAGWLLYSAAVSAPSKRPSRIVRKPHNGVARCVQFGGVCNTCHTDCFASWLRHDPG